MTSTVIGVDIGAAGALALVDEAGELVEVADMPILRDGPSNRPAVNGPLLAELVGRWRANRAFVEYVGARPGEGAVGAFAFGRSRGVIEGVLAALAVLATHNCARRVEAGCRHRCGPGRSQGRGEVRGYQAMAR